MTKRTVGTSFCALAVALFLSRYFIAVLYRGFNHSEWGSKDFDDYLRFVGVAPWILASIFLIAGIFYLVRGENEK